MLALALETSGSVGSVALGRGGDVLGSLTFASAKRHATDLLPSMARLCHEHDIGPADLECVYVSIGPGSFTGLRIGLAAARALALARGLKVIGVPSLDVTAQNALEAAPPADRVVVLIDAKRQCVFAATYERRGATYLALNRPREVPPEDYLSRQPPGCAVLGEGVAIHREAIARAGVRILPEDLHRPRAERLLALGAARAARKDFDDPRMLVPLYVRRPEAEEKLEAKQNQVPSS